MTLVEPKAKKKKDWFKELIEELRRLVEVVEHDTITIKHTVGKKILPFYREKKFQKGTGETIKALATEIGWSASEIYNCIKFAQKYSTPQLAIEDVSNVFETPTWYNICQSMLHKAKHQPEFFEIPQAAEGLQEELYETNVWILPEKRPEGYGSKDFRGNCDPTIIDQCLRRYLRGNLTKSVVLDPMAGSGTFVDVCKKLGIPKENIKAFDIKPRRKDIVQKDALELPIQNDSVDLVFCHYPYWNMQKYSENQDDFSNVNYLSFKEKVEKSFQQFHQILKTQGCLCVLIGNKRQQGILDLEAWFSEIGQKYFNLWDKIITIVSDPASHSHASHGKWGIISERALRQNWTIQTYDTLLIFQKL